jgi:hypothetical protein
MMMCIPSSLIITVSPQSEGDRAFRREGPRALKIASPAQEEVFWRWTLLSIGSIAIWSPTHLLRERLTG